MKQPAQRRNPTTPVCEPGFAAQNIPAEQFAHTDTASQPANVISDQGCDCECEMEGYSEEVQYIRDKITGKCICRRTGRTIITPCPHTLRADETKGKCPRE